MRQKLGQHFLKNTAAIEKIISALDLQAEDSIIEIGPGAGALTIPLARRCGELGCKIVAVEKDPDLVSSIMKRESLRNVEIIQGDALKILPEIINKLNVTNTARSIDKCYGVKVVGNIPYYITGKLLHILGEGVTNTARSIDKCYGSVAMIVLMIQKEVAGRLSAKPPKMNLLAAATQIWSKPEIIGYLKPKDFNPPPEVDSAIIKLKIDVKIKEKQLLERYYQLIKAAFKQPRKTLLNNLSTGLGIEKKDCLEILEKCGLQDNERPQNLSIEILEKLLTFLPLGNKR